MIPTNYMAIYAAVLSTIVFMWRLYEFYYDRKGKLRISILTGGQPLSQYFNESDIEDRVIAVITNTGRTTRYITTPYFMVSPGMVIKEELDLLLQNPSPYTGPTELIPGQQYRYLIDMPLLVKYRKAGARKIRVQIGDTHGRRYKSHWAEL